MPVAMTLNQQLGVRTEPCTKPSELVKIVSSQPIDRRVIQVAKRALKKLITRQCVRPIILKRHTHHKKNQESTKVFSALSVNWNNYG